MPMQVSDEEIIDKYIRTHKRPFAFETMYRSVSGKLQNMDKEECVSCLMSSPYVFVSDGMFVTHAGAFTGEYFSIKPTNAEAQQGILVAGGRCIPFVDSAIPPYMLSFKYEDKTLKNKIGKFTAGDAIDIYALYDPEFAPQYVAGDPANDIDIAANDYKLPAHLLLTGVALHLRRGDRLICRVTNWDKGVITIEKIEHTASLEITESDVNRQEWFDSLEEALLEDFEINGPRSSIDDQLSLTFMNHKNVLCTEECGSIMEYLEKSRKVAFVSYGVESRLWKAGEEVPVVGEWNKGKDGMYRDVLNGFVFAKNEVVNAILTSQLHEKVVDDDAVLQALLPPQMEIKKEDEEYLKVHISAMRDVLKKTYNWFADAQLAPLRSNTLKLYRQLRAVASDMYLADIPLDKYSQQALVVFLQIFSNVLKTLCMIEDEPDYVALNIAESNKALDNMESDAQRAMSILRETLSSKQDDTSDFVLVR